MAKFEDKISSIIKSQLPEFVLSEHPKFVQFMSAYYTFMESGELTLYDVESTDGILLETETNQENLLLLDAGSLGTARTQVDAGDKVIYEDSPFGKFTQGEIVKGSISGAEATILLVNTDKIIISAQDKFLEDEFIIGQTSNARARIDTYRPNPVNSIQDLVNFRDPDRVIESFLNRFRNEFLSTLPEQLSTGVDKRKLIKNIKSLYRLKGTKDGNAIFFRLLFGENVETEFLREQILRVSDGNWSSKRIIRTIDTTGDTSLLIGREIEGETSGAKSIVENVFRYTFGEYAISEFVVNLDTLTGTFQIGETLRGTESDENDVFIKSVVTGIPTTKNIINDGALNNLGDKIVLTGGGIGALFATSNIGGGSLSEIIVDQGGFDFNIGDELVFNNSGTNGSGASAFVSVVNGGLAFENAFVEGNTQFPEDALNADPLKKFLEGPVIAYDKNTVRPGRIGAVTINTNASGGSAGTYTVLHSQTTYSGNGANAIFSITNDGSSNVSVSITDGGINYSASETITIPASAIGGTSGNLVLLVSRVHQGFAELQGTINDADAGRTAATADRQAVTLTGQTSGATADVRYAVFGTTLAPTGANLTNHFNTTGASGNHDFNEQVLYITYTNNNRFIRGEEILVTRNSESTYYSASDQTFKITLDSEFGSESLEGGADIKNQADRDSINQMNRRLGNEVDQEDHIVMEDETERGDIYSGNKLVQERNTGVADITDIFVRSFGRNYESLPSITFPTGTSGQDAVIKSFGSEVGRIVEIKTIDHGIRYEQPPTPPSIEFLNNSIVTSVIGNFVAEETVTGQTSNFTGKVVSWDSARGLLKLSDVTGGPQVNETIVGGTSSARGTLFKTDHASANVSVGALAITDGEFVDEDGHLSENTMKIQDSLTYQDFSYLIRVGRSINEWRDSFKKTMHVAGFYFTGQVDIQSRLDARIKQRIVGATTGAISVPIASIVNTIFSNLVRRKLGTKTDGTTLRSNPNLATGLDGDTSTIRHFDDTTRDLTLDLTFRITGITSRHREVVNNILVAKGFGIGPRYGTLNRLANTAFQQSGITFAELSKLVIDGTGSGLDKRKAIFTATSDKPGGQRMRTHFTVPADVVVAKLQFDNTGFKFDNTAPTFDDTTP